MKTCRGNHNGMHQSRNERSRPEVVYATVFHHQGDRSRVRHASVASSSRSSANRTLVDRRMSVPHNYYAANDSQRRSSSSSCSSSSTLEQDDGDARDGRYNNNSEIESYWTGSLRSLATVERAVSQMSIPEHFNEKVGKLKAWTVHVTWDDSDAISYTNKERLVVIRPFHETKAQSNCQFQAITLKNKRSPLDRSLFEPVVRAMAKNSVMTGRFAMRHVKPAGLLVDAKSLSTSERNRFVRHCHQLGIRLPTDDAEALDSLAYCYLVAQLIEKFYLQLCRRYKLDDDSRHMGTCLKLVLHGPQCAAAFHLLNRNESFDNMRTVYLMSQPVLGHCLPLNQHKAREEADVLGLAYWYHVEREAIKNVDDFFVALPSDWFKVAKRHYGKFPDNDRHFVDGKCKLISIKLIT